jgi:hypothetical protein
MAIREVLYAQSTGLTPIGYNDSVEPSQVPCHCYCHSNKNIIGNNGVAVCGVISQCGLSSGLSRTSANSWCTEWEARNLGRETSEFMQEKYHRKR